MVTVQVLPVHAPLQPANTEPAVGLGVRTTTVPDAKSWLQVPPQLMPEGLLVTVPAPVPALATLSANFGGGGVPTEMVREQLTCWSPLVTLTVAWNDPVAV
jgi:hypothetical protein